jgi:signal transduction histidine kinase/signal recognition particle receptor subunit beta
MRNGSSFDDERDSMAIFNLQERTINAKIVYYGPALGGKTTSLKWVHHVLDPHNEIELVSLNTEQDRTLFFDFLPISLGTIEGFRIKLQAFTVPGQVKYNKTRKYVLTGADAVVLVIDSQTDQFGPSRDSLLNLDENLQANGLNPSEIPLVFQYNKRDIEHIHGISDLERELNTRDVASFATVATEGEGVFEAFTEVAAQTLQGLVGREMGNGAGEGIVSSLRTRLFDHLNEVRPGVRPSAPVRQGRVRKIVLRQPFADANKLVDERTGASDEDELLRHAVTSNMEVAGLLAEVHEARQELHRKVEELTTIHEAGKRLGSSLDEKQVLRTLLESATAGAESEHASILLPRSDGDGYFVRAVAGFREDPLVETLLGSDDGAGLVPEPGGEPVLVRREERPGLIGDLARLEPGLSEVVLVPIDTTGTGKAILAVYRVGPKSVALTGRIPFLRAITAQASIAIENARLFARVEDFNHKLEAEVEERTGELRAALEGLQELDRLKDGFLSSMSHELMTPLTSILSFSEILLNYEETPEDERREFLSIIRREAERLTSRLQDVLDLGQIEAGHVVWLREDMEIRPILNEVFDQLKEKILTRRVRVNIRQGMSAPCAHADPRWLTRALLHVLLNAVQWSPDGGRVGIAFHEEGGRQLITVSDEGPGIAEEDQDKVFDRFKQLGNVTRDKPSGTGVGLPMAQAIIEGMGGSIELRSEGGQGTTVTISLPAGLETGE